MWKTLFAKKHMYVFHVTKSWYFIASCEYIYVNHSSFKWLSLYINICILVFLGMNTLVGETTQSNPFSFDVNRRFFYKNLILHETPPPNLKGNQLFTLRIFVIQRVGPFKVAPCKNGAKKICQVNRLSLILCINSLQIFKFQNVVFFFRLKTSIKNKHKLQGSFILLIITVPEDKYSGTMNPGVVLW